jgi:hypothetical protein
MRRFPATPLVAALLLVLVVQLMGPAVATHAPANKVQVAGSAVQFMHSELVEAGQPTDRVRLLTGSIKTSKPTDLIFQVTAECALWTNIGTVGNGISEAFAQVLIWVEVDGQPVKVSSDDTGEDAGKVVFCNRAFRSETTNFDDDDEDDEIALFMRDRHANGFNWTKLNLGSGPHSIEVFAELTTQVTEDDPAEAFADAAVGKRTLVVEPTKLANDAVI